MINKKKIKEILENISNETQKVNYSLIYDLFTIVKGKCKDKNEFFTSILPKISENFNWDKENIIRSNIDKILVDAKFSDNLACKNFISKVAGLVDQKYRKDLEEILQNEFPENSSIVSIKKEAIDCIYPFFDTMFVTETGEEYILLAVGYGD